MAVTKPTWPTFAGLEAALVASTSAGAKLELIAQIQLILNLIPGVGPATSVTGASQANANTPPDFDVINPSVANQLIAELTQLQYTIQQGA